MEGKKENITFKNLQRIYKMLKDAVHYQHTEALKLFDASAFLPSGAERSERKNFCCLEQDWTVLQQSKHVPSSILNTATHETPTSIRIIEFNHKRGL